MSGKKKETYVYGSLKERFAVEWKIYALAFGFILIADNIGQIKIPVGKGMFILFPIFYAIILGVLSGPQVLKIVDNKHVKAASKLVVVGICPFIAKLGITAGANIDTILQSGPVLLLHGFGNLLGPLLALPVAILLGMSIFAGCGKGKEEASKDTTKTEKETEGGEENLLTGKHHVEIQVKDYGTIKVELDADAAPITVTNFVNLAKEGFYDGLTFHRIMSGFMIQGGDPRGDGTGGSDQTIKGEFSQNGVENNLLHTRGAISMARSRANDSASSQFFIVHEDSKHLDGSYAAFGYVTEGMDVVDRICEDAEPTDNNGTIPTEEQPVMTSVKVID